MPETDTMQAQTRLIPFRSNMISSAMNWCGRPVTGITLDEMAIRDLQIPVASDNGVAMAQAIFRSNP